MNAHETDESMTTMPGDLIRTARAVDDLVRAERDSAPPDLVERIAASVAPPVGRQWIVPLRVAAGLVLVAGLGGAIAMLGHAPGAGTGPTDGSVLAASLQSDLDEWIGASEPEDELDEQLDLLAAETAALDVSLESEWVTFEPLDGESM